MADEEKYGFRDASYSEWHRTGNIKEFVGLEIAQTLKMIDLDCTIYCEYDDRSRLPIALIEVAVFQNNWTKPATVTQKLAELARIQAWVCLYELSNRPLGNKPNCWDIDAFHIKRLNPSPQRKWEKKTPKEYAKFLAGLRQFSADQVDKIYRDLKQ